MALGMLTYDMFFPTAAFAVIFLAGNALFDVIRKKDSSCKWLLRLGLTLLPMTLAYIFFTHNYLINRYSYYYDNRLSDLSTLNLGDAAGQFLQNIGAASVSIFSQVSKDQFIGWQGPFVNPLLLPMVVLGLIYSSWNFRNSTHLFLLVLFLLQILPGPIVLNTPEPRILYTSMPSFMIWAAFGFFVLLGGLRALFGFIHLRHFAVPAFALILVAVLFKDYLIFSSSLMISEDKIMRRELADFSAASAKNTGMILYPYIPNQNDPAELESNVILFSIGGAQKIGLEAKNNFRQLHFSKVLPTLWVMRTLPGLDIFFYKNGEFNQEDRRVYLQSILGCYPNTELTASGQYFDVYHVPAQSLAQPRCYTPGSPIILEPQTGARLPTKQPITFSWDTPETSGKSFEITLERMFPGIRWIEIEKEFLGPGWTSDAKFVDGYTGEGFLLDDWGAGNAAYSFYLPETGRYRAWMRYFKRLDNDQETFLTIAGQTVPLAENRGYLKIWVWEDLGVFNLQNGRLPLSLSRAYNKDSQYSVFLDTLVITSSLEYDPKIHEIWQERFSTGRISSNETSYTWPSALPPGEYRWKVRLFNDDKWVDISGKPGLESAYKTFWILP